ncbi:serine/threonine-protein kinase KIN2 [Puccinia graminis f. sp. tritici]|uniref:Serine/threonine-protein kinase KIN2 n=1 Tax=Puccinia graminis f. sp. tritici TaxID=56615 RepID=A0A5B0MVT6_PUCGR|nr:serine/threonine-protein kinase KIN2 [Puccinia graminis f. sp. tritici]
MNTLSSGGVSPDERGRVVSMVEPANVLAGPSDSERSPTGFARRIGLGHKSSSKRLSPPFSPGGLQEQQQTAAQAQPDHVSDDIPTDAIPMSAPISGQSGPMAAFGAKSDLDANLSSRSRHHQRGSSAGGEAGHNDVPASKGEGKVALKSSASGPNWRPRMSSTSWCTHPLVGRNPSRREGIHPGSSGGIPPGELVHIQLAGSGVHTLSSGETPPDERVFIPARRREESLPASWYTIQLAGRDSSRRAGL